MGEIKLTEMEWAVARMLDRLKNMERRDAEYEDRQRAANDVDPPAKEVRASGWGVP